jgi:hypothetical protein
MKTELLGNKIRGKIGFWGVKKKHGRWGKKSSENCGFLVLKWSSWNYL